MHHEHHGDCCAPHEEHHHHEHLALPIGQLCCAGACDHAEHQGFAALEAAQLVQQVDTMAGKKKRKDTKNKQKMLGMYDLDVSAAIIGGMAVGLSQ